MAKKPGDLAEFKFSQTMVVSRLKNGKWIIQQEWFGTRGPRRYLKADEAAAMLEENGFRLESEEVGLPDHAVQRISDQMQLPFDDATDTTDKSKANGKSTAKRRKPSRLPQPSDQSKGPKRKRTTKKKAAAATS